MQHRIARCGDATCRGLEKGLYTTAGDTCLDTMLLTVHSRPFANARHRPVLREIRLYTGCKTSTLVRVTVVFLSLASPSIPIILLDLFVFQAKFVIEETMVNYALAVTLPLYIYPSSSAWGTVYDAVSSNTNTHFDIIINPSNGPGGSVPDSNYITGISTLNSYPNANLFGYVYTSYGDRNLSEIESDISTYNSWSDYTSADISLDGIFMDEAPTNTSTVQYMTSLYNYVKAVMPSNSNYVWTNPGTVVDADFYAAADIVNAFEGTYSAWESGGSTSIPTKLMDSSSVMLHNYDPATADAMNNMTASMVDAPYYGGLLTNRTGYQHLCGYWANFTAEVNSMNG